MIPFSVNGTTYYAKKGMTWEEWINSEYYDNNLKLCIIDGTFYGVDGRARCNLKNAQSNDYVHPEDIIVNQEDYNLFCGAPDKT